MNKTKTIYNTVRSVKFVLKPNSKQKETLESFFGLSRSWNHFKKLKLVEF